MKKWIKVILKANKLKKRMMRVALMSINSKLCNIYLSRYSINHFNHVRLTYINIYSLYLIIVIKPKDYNFFKISHPLPTTHFHLKSSGVKWKPTLLNEASLSTASRLDKLHSVYFLDNPLFVSQ